MTITKESIRLLAELVGTASASDVVYFARKVDTIEARWRRKFENFILQSALKQIEAAKETGRLDVDAIDFSPLVMEHSFDAMAAGIKSAERLNPITASDKRRLGKASGKPPEVKIPRSLADIRRMWDDWRKRKRLPARQRAIVERIKKAYIDKLQSVWKIHSESFRSGDVAKQDFAVEKIMKGAEVVYSRAKMIVETETTYYYNAARIQNYSGSPGITHYLFVAIRDHRTTAWCKTRQGIVYAKDDPIFHKETPPCFVGCSPVLTMTGWKDISTVIVGEYVWTHRKRWRKVTHVYDTDKRGCDIFQIGYALATSNHPYFERGSGFIEAEYFEPTKGVWASAADVQEVLDTGMDALVQARQEILLDQVSHHHPGNKNARTESSPLEWWQKNIEIWLRWYIDAGASESEPSGLRTRAYSRSGENAESSINSRRSSSPYQHDQVGQSSEKPAGYDGFGAYQVARKTRWSNAEKKFKVYNLEVEDDHTYFAGGYLVHNCHWNCRSEVLPLSPDNPKHKILIEDKTRWRKNNRCEKLPEGWTGR